VSGDTVGPPPSASEDELARFFELSLDLLVVAGFDGYFRRLNPAWPRTFGWTLDELFATPSIDFVHPDDRDKTLTARARLKDGVPATGLVNRYRCKDGSYRWLQWMSVAYLDRGFVYAVARDVTEQHQASEERERLQGQLIFSERLASVGRLAAGVAHEINNPLAFLMANLSFAIEQVASPVRSTKGDEELTSVLKEALAGAQRIANIVRDLKTFTRPQASPAASVRLEAVLELSINMVSNDLRHRARVVKDFGDTPPVAADEARLMQVIVNLLVNAAQSIPEGSAHANEVRVRTFTDGAGRAVAEIHDTGSGISPDVMPHIFDPFFTTKPVGTGTGLGLSISRSLVTGLGGELTVQSEVGKGTVARVALPPAAASAPRPSAGAAPELSFAEQTARVLVVDDEPAVGAALQRMLVGLEVTVVTGAGDALRLLREGQRFDVILADVMMPDITGIELYETLARELPEMARRMVFITGGAFTPRARAFLDTVPNPRTDKPFDPHHLRELIQGRLDR
jgi:PAS domain S-box-containing protein